MTITAMRLAAGGDAGHHRRALAQRDVRELGAQQGGGDRDRIHALKDGASRRRWESNMDRGLYLAASGMLAEQVRQDQIANDLANASTAGYKADRTTQQSFGEMLLTNSVTGATIGSQTTGVRVTATVTDLTPQPLKDTGEPLDFAINGDGFFAVQTADGTRYTRNGQFTTDAQGQLTTLDRRPRPRPQQPADQDRRRRQGRPAPAQRRPAEEPEEGRRQPRDRHAGRRRRPGRRARCAPARSRAPAPIRPRRWWT